MINFCAEPKSPCHKKPIKGFGFNMNRCYSSIYSSLCKHSNDTAVHITQEERDEWNNKASKEALKDIQDQLNKITSDERGSMKYEILLEVSKQITAAIASLNLGDYAKKKYVDDAIKNINLNEYVTQKYADSTYLKLVDYTNFDADSYYTKAEIQDVIKNSNIGKDYSIKSFTIEGNKLILTQKTGGQFKVTLSGDGSGSGIDADYVQHQLLNYIKKNTLSKLVINDNVYSLENGGDIKIPTSSTNSNIDPTKFGYYKSYFKETTSSSAAPSKPDANKPPQDGSGWVDTTPNYRSGYCVWMTQVFINGNEQYGEYTNPICLTGTAGESAVSYDIKTSTGTINYQDGTMYPNLISVYVAKSDGSQVTNITPSNSPDWYFSYSINGGDTWTAISSDQIQTEGDNGMLFKATNESVTLTEYVPIVKSGSNGETYSLQLSNISLSYVSADQDYNLQMSCNVNLYKNENAIDSAEANLYNLYAQLNSNSRTSLQYNSDHWDATVNTIVQSKSSTITIYAYNTNDAYLTSVTIPVSAYGDAQTFKGSPLRVVGEWSSGTKYYDGKREAESGIFYQDVVLYKNTYYVCVNTSSGEDDHWASPPIAATYWSALSLSADVVANLVVSNKAFIKELSSNELVIFDGDNIVAGMTSSKAIDESSPLNGNVNNKGGVRIWAGEISNADLTTAPFTVTNTGTLKSTDANITGEINATSGSIGNLSIKGKMTGESTGGYVAIDGSSIGIYGNDDDWSDGSRIRFYASDSQARGFIAGMTNDTDSVLTISKIGSGLDGHSGDGPCLRLNAEFANDRVLDINGSVTGFQREIHESNTDQKIQSGKSPFDGNYNIYTFTSSTDSDTVTLKDDYFQREFIIINNSIHCLTVKTPSTSYKMYVSGYTNVMNEYQMQPREVKHVIQMSYLDNTAYYLF